MVYSGVSSSVLGSGMSWDYLLLHKLFSQVQVVLLLQEFTRE